MPCALHAMPPKTHARCLMGTPLLLWVPSPPVNGGHCPNDPLTRRMTPNGTLEGFQPTCTISCGGLGCRMHLSSTPSTSKKLETPTYLPEQDVHFCFGPLASQPDRLNGFFSNRVLAAICNTRHGRHQGSYIVALAVSGGTRASGAIGGHEGYAGFRAHSQRL